MNKNEMDKRIILYLDKQLSSEEELQFEQAMLNSLVLKERFEELKTTFLSMKNASNPAADENYFIYAIPRFREMTAKRKKTFILPRYSAMLSGSAVLLIMVLSFLLFNSNDEITKELPDLNASELQLADEEYSIMEDLSSLPVETSEYLENKIDSLLNEEFISYEGAENYLSSRYENTLLSDISTDEAEMIYDQIINKDILNGEL